MKGKLFLMPIVAPNAQNAGNFNPFWLRLINKYLFDKSAPLRTIHCLATGLINFNDNSAQPLFTVPDGTYCMVSQIFIRPGGTTVITSGKIFFAWDPGSGTTATFDFALAFPTLDGSSNFAVLPPPEGTAGATWADPSPVSSAGAIFSATMGPTEGVDTFALVDVFGFLAPVEDLT